MERKDRKGAESAKIFFQGRQSRFLRVLCAFEFFALNPEPSVFWTHCNLLSGY